MKRRVFIALVGGAAAWPFAKSAQGSVPTIGYLGSRSQAADAKLIAAFHSGLEAEGFAQGRNINVSYHWAEGKYERLPEMAADFVNRSMAVIVATGGTPTALAAKAATGRIPIVFIVGSDPVQWGLVESMARPGGNVTGFAIISVGLDTKRFEFLLELLPQARRIAFLVNPANPNADATVAGLRVAADTARREIVVGRGATDTDLEAAFRNIRETGANALVVAADPFFASRYDRLVKPAATSQIPTIYQFRDFVDAGGLMSYGPSRDEPYRQAGIYTGRILKGVQPADLPVQQPTKFELVINLKTAKALDLQFPPSLLARAEEVIE